MKALSGYRIALFHNICWEDFFSENGASMILLDETPDSEEEFRNWYQEEVAKAKQDKVAMVVVISRSNVSHRKSKFFDNIEEMEFYSSDGGGGGRVRFTKCQTIFDAIYDGGLITDDWSESISRGEIIYGDTKKAPSWLIQGVCVELKHNKAQAVIKEVHRGSCAVVEEEVECGKSTLTVHSGDISLVKPREHDAVISIATKGYQEGVEGWLVAIDREDAIVKEADGNFKIVDYEYLAKISSV